MQVMEMGVFIRWNGMVEWNNGTVEWWNSGTTTPIERALMTTFTQHLVTGLRLGDLHHREY